LGYFFASFGCQSVSSRFAALLATFASKLDGSGVPLVLDAIFGLSGGDVSDQLAQLNRVAWALEPLRCHAPIIAKTERRFSRGSSALNFKLTHYHSALNVLRGLT
jgi:hypothetical protein